MKTVLTQFLEQARKHPDNPAVLDIPVPIRMSG